MIQMKVVIGYFFAKFFNNKEPQIIFCENLEKLTKQTTLFPCVYYNYGGTKIIKYFNVYFNTYNSKNKPLAKNIKLKISGPISKKEKNLRDRKIFFEPLPKDTRKIEIVKVSLTFMDNKRQNIVAKNLDIYKEENSPCKSAQPRLFFIINLFRKILNK